MFVSRLIFAKLQDSPSALTEIYNVIARGEEGRLGAMLGQVKWYANWRRYCFFPIEDSLFDASCLKEIEDFITALMDARK
jgi:hypothetical protein